ncbi:PPP5 phosphatase, partial [Gymnorhina tibicen]|nr:PPP5 phosphatase [Gymnorhina tibicen]
VVKVRPNDKDAKLKYQECHRIVKQKAFERAIASDEHKRSVVDSLDIESMSETPRTRPRGPGVGAQGSLGAPRRAPSGGSRSLRGAGVPMRVPGRVWGLQEGSWGVYEGPWEEAGGDAEGTPGTLPGRGHCPEPGGQIFNGDFVDRGSFSVEVILTLFGFKLLYPDHFHLLRGNHETDNMNQIYGFEGEVKAKYTAQMFALFSEVFEWLPLAQCINGKVLVRGHRRGHRGGDIVTGAHYLAAPIDCAPRCPHVAPMSPRCPQNGRSVSKRGVSCQFGPDVTKRFLERNRLELIIRSHEVKPEGYEVAHDGRCVTVFSAPNYCDQMGNKGSYIHLRGSDLRPDFHQFTAV